ncbi:MAG: methyltransferase [Acholeplasmatales bacterium]|jgi:tRNA (guanine-N7-)-methyltransferase|nr:methyltransferase [Acholeplasmatales bacterium]
MRYRRNKYATLDNLIKMGLLTDDSLKKTNNILLEVGSGRGKFISSLALLNKELIYVAVEKNYNACYQIMKIKENLQIDNLFVIRDDCINIFNYLEKESINEIYINFPDPWLKNRNAKNRLVGLDFLGLFYSLLKKGGVLIFTSDEKNLYDEIILNSLAKQFKIREKTEDLPIREIMTEYEIKKRLSTNIYQVILEK